MPALPWEIGETIREGVIIHPSRSFIRILGNNNCVTGVECIKLKWAKFDEEGGLHLEPIKGSEHVLQADTVIFGIGQVPDLSLVSDVREIKIAKRGTIIVDPKTLATGYPHVFAGGDVVEGPAWVINAIAAGRKAAISIDKDLGGRGVIEQTLGPPELTVASLPSSLPVGERGPMPSLPVPERLNSFAEVEVGLTEEMAMKEASRCLRCDLPITIDSAKCTGCRICEFRCSFSHENVFNLSMSRVKVRRLIKAENEYSISITDQCDDCGICARYCPYEALIRERREYEV
jgi:NADH-quinone oxidoreductase subunit F